MENQNKMPASYTLRLEWRESEGQGDILMLPSGRRHPIVVAGLHRIGTTNHSGLYVQNFALTEAAWQCDLGGCGRMVRREVRAWCDDREGDEYYEFCDAVDALRVMIRDAWVETGNEEAMLSHGTGTLFPREDGLGESFENLVPDLASSEWDSAVLRRKGAQGSERTLN